MYCVLNMGWTPSQYMNLPYKERVFVIASVMTKLDEEKEQQRKLNAKKPNTRRRR